LSIWPYYIRLRPRKRRKKNGRLQQAKNLRREAGASGGGVTIKRSSRGRVWFVIGATNLDT